MALKNKECVICKIKKKDFIIEDRYILIALEIPYMNLFAHPECYNSIEYSELSKFLQENQKIWYNY